MTKEIDFFKCPVCGSTNIDAGEPWDAESTDDLHDKERPMECKDCGEQWDILYQLKPTGIRVTGHLEEPIQFAPALKVTIEVSGGIAEVTSCPDEVEVEIIDHDNDRR